MSKKSLIDEIVADLDTKDEEIISLVKELQFKGVEVDIMKIELDNNVGRIEQIVAEFGFRDDKIDTIIK